MLSPSSVFSQSVTLPIFRTFKMKTSWARLSCVWSKALVKLIALVFDPWSRYYTLKAFEINQNFTFQDLKIGNLQHGANFSACNAASMIQKLHYSFFISNWLFIAPNFHKRFLGTIEIRWTLYVLRLYSATGQNSRKAFPFALGSSCSVTRWHEGDQSWLMIIQKD